jgi:hypothetical protein
LQNVFKSCMEWLTWVIANNGEYCHQKRRLKSYFIWGLWDRPGDQVLFRHAVDGRGEFMERLWCLQFSPDHLHSSKW